MKKIMIMFIVLMSLVWNLSAGSNWVEIPIKNAKFEKSTKNGKSFENWKLHEVDMIKIDNKNGVGIPKQKMTNGPSYSALKQFIFFDTKGKYKRYYIEVTYKTDNKLKETKTKGNTTQPRILLVPISKDKKRLWPKGSEGASGKLIKNDTIKVFKYIMRGTGNEDGIEICFDSTNPDYRALIKEVKLFGELPAK